MKKQLKTPTPDMGYKEITRAGIMQIPGNADEYNTGEWRSMRPIWYSDKCKHCLLCFPVCPDSSILVENEKMVGIDMKHCKGCGICVEACPFNAFDYKKEE